MVCIMLILITSDCLYIIDTTILYIAKSLFHMDIYQRFNTYQYRILLDFFMLRGLCIYSIIFPRVDLSSYIYKITFILLFLTINLLFLFQVLIFYFLITFHIQNFPLLQKLLFSRRKRIFLIWILYITLLQKLPLLKKKNIIHIFIVVLSIFYLEEKHIQD